MKKLLFLLFVVCFSFMSASCKKDMQENETTDENIIAWALLQSNSKYALEFAQTGSFVNMKKKLDSDLDSKYKEIIETSKYLGVPMGGIKEDYLNKKKNIKDRVEKLNRCVQNKKFYFRANLDSARVKADTPLKEVKFYLHNSEREDTKGVVFEYHGGKPDLVVPENVLNYYDKILRSPQYVIEGYAQKGKIVILRLKSLSNDALINNNTKKFIHEFDDEFLWDKEAGINLGRDY